MIARVYCMTITSTRLINYKVYSLNAAQLTILLNRERRKLLLARGHHSRTNEVAEIQHSIHELQRILQHKELQQYGRHADQPVRRF